MTRLKRLLRQLLPPILVTALTTRWWKRTYASLPDRDLYRPLFSPWLGLPGFAEIRRAVETHTLVSPDRLWVLYSLARQAAGGGGAFVEAGVYRGGTAMLLKHVIERANGGATALHLFDTFAGMPETDARRDFHKQGDFADTSLAAVRDRVGAAGFVHYHPGLIPDTFADAGVDAIALAHVDVDIYQSVLDCCAYIYPRLKAGGFLVFDDYGFPSCPGARAAVDWFFADKPEVPLVLPTGQAVVIRAGDRPAS